MSPLKLIVLVKINFHVMWHYLILKQNVTSQGELNCTLCVCLLTVLYAGFTVCTALHMPLQSCIWLHAAYDHHHHHAGGTKCLPSCDSSLAEISSAFRHNCMKWKAAKRQVLKISVVWLRGREESSEHSWSPWVYEAYGCDILCVGWWFMGVVFAHLCNVWVYYWILFCVSTTRSVFVCLQLLYVLHAQWELLWDKEQDTWVLRVNSL